jgi:hypothetical protein
MYFKKVIITFTLFFLLPNVYAICIKNRTDFKMYYEIRNYNICPAPKTKFHQGYLKPHQDVCYDHSSSQGDDWKIYRNDGIDVWKIEKNGDRTLACSKGVRGILNFLEVSRTANQWWCLDRDDYED